MTALPRTPRGVVFDAVGTLIHPEPAATLVYDSFGRRFGSRHDPAEIARRFRAAFRREEERDRLAGQTTSETREWQRWRDIVAAVLDDVTDPGRCFEELFEHFARPTAWVCRPGTGEVLAELSRRGYVLGLASNYDRRLRPVAAGLPELAPLQHLIISSEVGWRKPAVEFYTAVCRSLDLPAHQLLYVGDDPVNDYAGARAAGLEALLFDPTGETPDGPDRLVRLEDLLSLLPERAEG